MSQTKGMGKWMQMNSVGGALLGVSLTNYATGKLGILQKIVSYLPASNLAFIAVNAAGGVLTMSTFGGAQMDSIETITVAVVTAVAYNALLEVVPGDVHNKLSGLD